MQYQSGLQATLNSDFCPYAEMIFHTNLPNEWVEQPTVKDFFAKLRPGFMLLTASELQALRDQAARHQHRETSTQTA